MFDNLIFFRMKSRNELKFNLMKYKRNWFQRFNVNMSRGQDDKFVYCTGMMRRASKGLNDGLTTSQTFLFYTITFCQLVYKFKIQPKDNMRCNNVFKVTNLLRLLVLAIFLTSIYFLQLNISYENLWQAFSANIELFDL